MGGVVVLVTGAAGLLGTWLRRTVPDDVEVVGLTHRRRLGDGREVTADLRDPVAVDAAVEHVAPDVVVHAAYARDEASIVGASATLARASAQAGAGFVHVSSEAVFAGDGARRTESDEPDPVWDYGRWKVDSEREVVRHRPDAALVRLPLLTSLDPEDHIVRAVRDVVAGGRPTTWFSDEMRMPARAEEVARAVWRIAALTPVEHAGVWHLAGPERLSRADLARRVVDRLDLPREGIAVGPTPVGAHRPRDLVLGDDRARTTVDWDPSPVYSEPD